MSIEWQNRIEALEARVRILEDVQAITRLKNGYCIHSDGGWPAKPHTHAGSVADDFTDDGVWDGRPFAPRVEGREAIRELFRNYRTIPFVIHYVMNPRIDVEGDAATGHWHLLAPLTSPDGSHRWVMGMYRETYVRKPEGWKCTSLRFDTARVVPVPAGWGEPLREAS